MSSFHHYSHMEESGDTMSTFFSDTPLDENSQDRALMNEKMDNKSFQQQITSPSKAFGQFYGQWLGSYMSPYPASDVLSPNASQMSFSLVSPCPVSPNEAMSSSMGPLFPRGDHLSLAFSPNLFSPLHKSSHEQLHSLSSTNVFSSNLGPMKADRLQSLIGNYGGNSHGSVNSSYSGSNNNNYNSNNNNNNNNNNYNNYNNNNNNNNNNNHHQSLYSHVYFNQAFQPQQVPSVSSSSTSTRSKKDLHKINEAHFKPKKKSAAESYHKKESIENSTPSAIIPDNSPSSGLENDDSQEELLIATSSPDRPNKCNCKKSKCLKLYCECFQALRFCKDCNCMDCFNDLKHNDSRMEAVKAVKEKNHSAFQIKIVEDGHASGCHCKQSKCLKKYCECFHASTFCGTNCKCKSCANYEGSKDLNSIRQSYADKKLIKPIQPGSTNITTTTTTTSIVLDMKTETKRKESPTSITNIVDVLSPSPFNTQTNTELVTPGASPIAVSASEDIQVNSYSMIKNSENKTIGSCVDGIASLPRNTRRRNTDVPEPIFAPITTRSSKRAAEAQLEQPKPLQPTPPTQYRTLSSHQVAYQMAQLVANQSIEQSAAFVSSGSGSSSSTALIQSTAVDTQGSIRAFNLRSLSTLPTSIKSSIQTKQSNLPTISKLSNNQSKSVSKLSSQPLKKRKVKGWQTPPIVYPFFGPSNPSVPKVIALRCLEYLSGTDFYSISVTSSLWDSAARDEALWETN